MQFSTSRKGIPDAFTLLELFIVCSVILLLACVIVPVTVKQQMVRKQTQCSNNLKDIGLAFRLWSTDSSDDFPTVRSTNRGGTLEYFSVPDSTFLHFLAISNELSTPQPLTCPFDLRSAAKSFFQLSNRNLSYFVAAGTDIMPGAFLGGDRNVITNGSAITNGLLILNTNLPGGWDERMHNLKGNLVFMDGSVRSHDNSGFTRALRYAETNYGPQRLSVPW
jgi:prepilin-type processing-associated H-X9-DG protein